MPTFILRDNIHTGIYKIHYNKNITTKTSATELLTQIRRSKLYALALVALIKLGTVNSNTAEYEVVYTVHYALDFTFSAQLKSSHAHPVFLT
jgi:hypothetical protein